jgi:hypothetical protein
VKSVSIAPGGVSSQPFNPDGSGSPWCGQAGQRACAPKSRNYTYSAGLVLKPNSTVTVRSLGRWHSAFASRKHTLSLFFGGDNLTSTPGGAVPVVFNLSAVGARLLGRADVDMATCEADGAGFCYAPLEKPLTVRPGSVYFVVSEESASLDADLVWWGRELGGGGVRIIPADGSDDQNRGPYTEGNLGPLRLTGSVAIVNGTARYQADASAVSCADEAPVAQCGGGSALCTSCTSSDWMAPSCPKGWSFESVCCATYTAKCVGITPNNGFSAFGPVSVRIEMPVKADDDALTPRSRGSVAPVRELNLEFLVTIRSCSSTSEQFAKGAENA